MGVAYAISPADLAATLHRPDAPIVLDVCRADLCEARGTLIPTARRADHADGPALAATLPRDRRIVVACVHGHNRSQRVVAHLRAAGLSASILDNGYDGWIAAGLPLVRISAGSVTLGGAPTVWVTRRRPKIDRVACPWLIRRFLDDRATFLFVDPDQAMNVAETDGSIAYDLPGAPFEHEGEFCTFDILLRDFGLAGEPSLARLAAIVRGADTDRLDLAPQAAGLLAASLGLSALSGEDDAAMLGRGFWLYDGLFAWLRSAAGETHNWPRGGA